MAFPAATARYILFLFNLLFLISGLSVAATALLVELSFFNNSLFLEGNVIWSPPIIIIIACGIICLVSLFGCCGAVKESRWILLLFSVLLFIVFIVEVVAGIYVYHASEDIGTSLLTTMKSTMKDYGNVTKVTRGWDTVQYDLHCCGVNNASDWYSTKGFLPSTCCLELPNKTCELNNAYKKGCYELLENFLRGKALILAAVTVGIGITQLICAIISGLLARHINKQYEAV